MNTSLARRFPPENFSEKVFAEKNHNFCVAVFVLNEGERVLTQLERMQSLQLPVDIVVADGGSDDGSTDHDLLSGLGVNTLLTKRCEGALGTQMRMAFAWALGRGYEGVITMDGNGKDDPSVIPEFVSLLNRGFDHVQGSRFIDGGYHENTPFLRLWGVRGLHAPLISMAAKFRYTDTTNGFRAYSARFLSDQRVALFREVFTGYELHYYLAIEAPLNGFKCTEHPVSRVYPQTGKVPTKISPIAGNLKVLWKLLKTVSGRYRSNNGSF